MIGRKKSSRHPLRRILVAGAAIACLAFVSWRWYPVVLRHLGEFLIEADQPEPSDAILVLAGDFFGPRVLKGAELGVQGFAPYVLISGTGYGSRGESEQAIEFLVQKGYPRALFRSLPHHAKSTIEEAVALAPELQRLGVHRALLVTRASHSRRASIVFRLFCPNARFRAIPAADEFQARSWWTDPVSKERFYQEWSKILGTLLWKYPELLARSQMAR